MTKLKKTSLLFFLFFFTSFISLRSFKKVQIDDLLIESELVSRNDVLKNSSLEIPQRLIFIQTNSLEKELKENLSLKYISINKQIIPFGLKIFLKQRTPIAYAEMIKEGATIRGYIDANGIFIPEGSIDINNDFNFNLRIYGWKQSSSNQLEKILKINSKFDIEINEITISDNGFITLKEKNLNSILLGFNSENLDTQLQLLVDMKRQLKELGIITEIEMIDLTDPINPKIKVFKS